MSMDSQTVVDLGREALWTMLILGSPVLIAGLIVGLTIGLFQAMTQIQEQSVVFVPKIVVMLLVLSATLPWLIARTVQYTTELIGGIPGRF
jgi:flagellar biosynthesis protein FliQ